MQPLRKLVTLGVGSVRRYLWVVAFARTSGVCTTAGPATRPRSSAHAPQPHSLRQMHGGNVLGATQVGDGAGKF
jgi:hypothetical protein